MSAAVVWSWAVDQVADTYQQHLAKKITSEGLNVTLLTRFHPDIRRLLAHPALRGVVVPSRAEPFGRVPIEHTRPEPPR